MKTTVSKISQNCAESMECLSVCPTESIYYGVGQYVIDTDSCEGCQLCIQVCPQNAIYSEDLGGKSDKASDR